MDYQSGNKGMVRASASARSLDRLMSDPPGPFDTEGDIHKEVAESASAFLA